MSKLTTFRSFSNLISFNFLIKSSVAFKLLILLIWVFILYFNLHFHKSILHYINGILFIQNNHFSHFVSVRKPLTAYNLDKNQKRIIQQPYLTVKEQPIQKKAAAKFKLNIPIKTCPNIFQYIKSDRDAVNPLNTAGIYRV